MNFEMNIYIGWLITVIVTFLCLAIIIRQLSVYYKKSIMLHDEMRKKDIQIKTSDEALKRLCEIREKIYALDKLIVELAKEHGTKAGQRLLKPDRQIHDVWVIVEEKIASFAFFFESREVILHNFLGLQRKLTNHYEDLTDKIYALMEQYYYNSNINVPLNSIEKDATRLVEENSRESIAAMNRCISDYILELQNTFLAEMFDQNVIK